MNRWASLLIAVLLGVAGGNLRATEVGLIKINGTIMPATADYISRAVDLAGERHEVCLIIQLDTPGGLVISMQDIIKKIFASPVPIVVYVAPAGAMATSAGCYITMAADIAAMSPKATIGAAHVVTADAADSKMDDVMKQKLENFGVSYIDMIATNRNRNAEWARSAAKDSVSVTAKQALNLNVIDLIADDMPGLLKQLNGRKVNGQVMNTSSAAVFEIPMTMQEKFLQIMLQPGIMFALMLMVMYGIIGELSSPGAILPGVVGVIALILVLYMSATLPVNIAGVALMAVAVALFIIDVFATTHGILTAGGIVAFFLGALMLFDRHNDAFRLSLGYIIAATVVTALFFIFIVGAGLRAQFRPATTGKETMLGQTVKALSRIDAAGGRVLIEGEDWRAVSETMVERGQPVEVVGIEGLTLKVKPKV